MTIKGEETLIRTSAHGCYAIDRILRHDGTHARRGKPGADPAEQSDRVHVFYQQCGMDEIELIHRQHHFQDIGMKKLNGPAQSCKILARDREILAIDIDAHRLRRHFRVK